VPAKTSKEKTYGLALLHHWKKKQVPGVQPIAEKKGSAKGLQELWKVSVVDPLTIPFLSRGEEESLKGEENNRGQR